MITFEHLRQIDAKRLRLDQLPSPRLAALTTFINENFPEFEAVVTADGYCNTDRPIRGSRLVIRGKGRHGNRLTVTARATVTLNSPFGPHTFKAGEVVYQHNAAETYRTNYDVVEWIVRRHKELHKAA